MPSIGSDPRLEVAKFLEACGNAAELFEAGKAALDEMALGVEVLVERVFGRARRVVQDDGERVLVGNGSA